MECPALVAYAKARKGTNYKIPDTPIRALGRLLWFKASKGETFVRNQIHSTYMSFTYLILYFLGC